MILISAWSAPVSGKPSPKSYPQWVRVVEVLKKRGLTVVQVARRGEPDICASERLDDRPLRELRELLGLCRTWASVDNFFHHLAWSVGKRGVAIFGQSDPLIFGHPENLNLLLDRKHLRAEQWWLWSQTEYRPEVFVKPEAVVSAIESLL